MMAASLRGQTLPSSTEEQRATPRDPAYRPATVPLYLKDSAENETPAQRFFRNPENRSEDDPARAIEIETPEQPHPLEEARLEEEFRRGEDRRYLERTYLPQFGWRIDPDSHNPFYGQPRYTETPVERGRNIFLLSSPFTFGLSYALMVASKQAMGLPTSLTNPQSVAVVGLGAILSGLIVWYDYRRVWSKDTAGLDRFAKELQRERHQARHDWQN